MTKQEIMDMFPMEIMITQEMIDIGRDHLFDSWNCTGAQMLKSLNIGKGQSWGNLGGTIYLGGEENLHLIASTELMEIRKPRLVSLKAVTREDRRSYTYETATFDQIENLKYEEI